MFLCGSLLKPCDMGEALPIFERFRRNVIFEVEEIRDGFLVKCVDIVVLKQRDKLVHN